MSNRKEHILQWINESPNDPGNYYLLALELRSEGDIKGAMETFERLHSRFPDYLAHYYPFVELLISQSETKKALEMIDLGIHVAREAKNQKAEGELKFLRLELEEWD
ncbi:MAG TPA: hypothetical protein VFV37_07395 [Luteibaculaceae bacterium]|nr:hypothetical protein [Luteibaculaceae bacterium]